MAFIVLAKAHFEQSASYAICTTYFSFIFWEDETAQFESTNKIFWTNTIRQIHALFNEQWSFSRYNIKRYITVS